MLSLLLTGLSNNRSDWLSHVVKHTQKWGEAITVYSRNPVKILIKTDEWSYG